MAQSFLQNKLGRPPGSRSAVNRNRVTLCSSGLPTHVTEMPVSDCLIQGP